jgi:hypothetical protein
MARIHGERDLNLAHRMRAVGVPLDRDEFEERLIVQQDREPLVNSIASRYLTRSHIGLSIQLYITIVSNSGAPLTLHGFRIWLPWSDTPVALLQDPADPFAPATYRFPGETSGGFDRSQLIARSCKTLTRGQAVEGFLLGSHGDPIPRSFRHGTEVPVVLVIEDQFGEVYSKELFLTVDRLAERGSKPKLPQPRKRLFDRVDSPIEEAQPKAETVKAV